MALTADGLQVLAEMINGPASPSNWDPGIEAGLPPWGGRELPIRNALLGEYLMVSRLFAIQTLTREMQRDRGWSIPWAGSSPISRTGPKGISGGWIDGLETALDQPPFRRPPLPEIEFSGATAWWLQNGYGKSLAETSLPSAVELYQRVYILLAWRDLVALAGRSRGSSSGQEAAPAALEADLAASGRIDPFSGRPYLYSQTRQCLYSVAENLADDGGDPRKDLIVPFPGSPGSAR